MSSVRTSTDVGVDSVAGEVEDEAEEDFAWRAVLRRAGGSSVDTRSRNVDWSSLTEVDLSSLGLGRLPREVAGWKSLKKLKLLGNNLTELPAEVSEWSELQELSLLSNKLTALPPAVRTWRSLRKFHLFDNNLTELPAEVSEWIELQELDLSSNKLTALPPAVGGWKSLKMLDLSSNNLTELPAEVSEWSELQVLSLSGNKLTAFPPAVRTWRSLRKFHLSCNNLPELPADVSEWSELQVLSLYSNKLTALPPAVGGWKSLKKLDLSNNNLTELPAEVSKWSKLQKLSLSENKLTALPTAVGLLKSLSGISLSGCPVRPVSVQSMRAVDVVAFYRNLAARAARIDRQRIVLLGAKEKGKTSLMRRLLSGAAVPKIAQNERAFGVQMEKWKRAAALSVRNSEDGSEIIPDIEFWDFGGQEGFFPTNQLFLNCEAVFLLVFSWEDEVQDIISQIRQFHWMVRGYCAVETRRRPVVLVGTHSDRYSGAEAGRELRVKWERLMHDLAVDNELKDLVCEADVLQHPPAVVSSVETDDNRSGICRLLKLLQQVLQRQEQLGSDLYPNAYVEVGKLVSEHRVAGDRGDGRRRRTATVHIPEFEGILCEEYEEAPFVSVDRFGQQFCAAPGLLPQSDVPAVLRFLDLCGMVHFRPDEGLVFLDPQWISRDVISHAHRLKSETGIFERSQISDHWKTLPESCRENVPTILRAFELAFVATKSERAGIAVSPPGDSEQWMIPLALPKWNTSEEADGPFGPEGSEAPTRRYYLRVRHAADGFVAVLLHRWFKIFPEDKMTVLRADGVVISLPPHDAGNECWARMRFEKDLEVELIVSEGAEWLASVLAEKVRAMVRERYKGLRVEAGGRTRAGLEWIDAEQIQAGQTVAFGRRRQMSAASLWPFPHRLGATGVGSSDELPQAAGSKRYGYEAHVYVSHSGEGHPAFAWLLYRVLHRLGVFVALDVERDGCGGSGLDRRAMERAIHWSLSGLVIAGALYDWESDEAELLATRRGQEGGVSFAGNFVAVPRGTGGELCRVGPEWTGRAAKVVQQSLGEDLVRFSERVACKFLGWLRERWTELNSERDKSEDAKKPAQQPLSRNVRFAQLVSDLEYTLGEPQLRTLWIVLQTPAHASIAETLEDLRQRGLFKSDDVSSVLKALRASGLYGMTEWLERKCEGSGTGCGRNNLRCRKAKRTRRKPCVNFGVGNQTRPLCGTHRPSSREITHLGCLPDLAKARTTPLVYRTSHPCALHKPQQPATPSTLP